jgi:hypothetical protein
MKARPQTRLDADGLADLGALAVHGSLRRVNLMQEEVPRMGRIGPP